MRGEQTNVSNSRQTVFCSMAFLVCSLLSFSFLLLYICHKNMISLDCIDCLPFTVSIQTSESLFTQFKNPDTWERKRDCHGCDSFLDIQDYKTFHKFSLYLFKGNVLISNPFYMESRKTQSQALQNITCFTTAWGKKYHWEIQNLGSWISE